MTVGFFSPLPPAPSGVADYGAALARALAPLFSLRMNAPGDVNLYQIGNNAQHRDIYNRAVHQPGVVVIHDAVLHHFFLGQLTELQYVAEFIYNYGPWSEDLARQLWSHRARSASDPRYFRYPMLKRIAESAQAVVVHNPAAAAIVAQHAPSARIVEIEHLFEKPVLPAAFSVERLRTELGCPPSTLLCGVFGHLRESKRVPAVLRAVSRLGGRAKLLVAGDFVSTDLARSLQPSLQASGIIRRPHLPEAEFWRYAAAVDACINLRYPAAGETSGIATRLMGIGKPVLLTTSPENSRYPEAACIRIDPGEPEEELITAHLEWLAEHRADARQMGRHAAEHIGQHHAPEKVAERFREVLSGCYHRNS